MKANNKIHIFLTFLALVMFLTSCDRRPLDYFYVNYTRIVVRCDWSRVPDKPSGMSLYIFKDGETNPRVITTSSVDSVEVNLDEGHYKMFIMNQSTTEFGTYSFLNMDNYKSASSSLTAATSSWYVPDAAISEALGREPENLGVAIADDFDITEEMVSAFQSAYKRHHGHIDPNPLKDLTTYIDVTANNTVSKLVTRVYIGGIYNLYSIRGGISKMAKNFLMTQTATDKDEATQLLEGWTEKIDNNDATRGYVEIGVSTLGLPSNVITNEEVAKRDTSANLLRLSLLLVDGKTISYYKFGVGKKIEIQKGPEGYRLLHYITLGTLDDPAIIIPDVPPAESGGGGFTAIVDDWGDEVNVDIPI